MGVPRFYFLVRSQAHLGQTIRCDDLGRLGGTLAREWGGRCESVALVEGCSGEAVGRDGNQGRCAWAWAWAWQ